MKSKEYWNKKISDWERSSYQGPSEDLSLIEKIATRFRAPIKIRREVLLNVMKDLIQGKTVLELGCGSGDLCFKFLELGAGKVIGIDIADEAIRAARAKAVNAGMQGKTEFFVRDIRDNAKLPDSDFVVGLGFIDYMDILRLKKLFAGIKGKFIFSFPEKKTNLINTLQYLYLKSQGCPSFYKFKRRDFDEIPGMDGECHFFSISNMVFIANFNPLKNH